MAEYVVDYLDGNTPELVLVQEDDGKRLQGINEQGRHVSLRARRVWVRYDQSGAASDFATTAELLRKRIDALREEIDVAFLWEMIRADIDAADLDAITALYFGDAEHEAQSAMLRTLLEDSIYFSRKGDQFAPRSEKQVEQQLIAIRRTQEKAERRARLQQWLEAALGEEDTDEPLAVPDDMAPALDDLQAFLLNDKQSDVTAVLNDLAGEMTAREMAFELLVRAERIDSGANAMLVMAGVRLTFPDEVTEQDALLPTYEARPDREDFTALPAFSIDDASTRDIDDALTVERLGDGALRVGIHIADVPFFVAPNDPLDVEARRRGLSVYVPTQTVPMFPGRLSHELASLVESTVRPCFTVEATFDADFALTDWRIVRGQLRVAHRLTYDAVDAVLDGTDEAHPLAEELKTLDALTRHLEQQRLDQGGLIIEQPELVVKVYDEEDIRVSMIPPEAPARRVVSELMIFANERAAAYGQANEVPLIFKVQDAPEDEALIGKRLTYDPVRFGQILRGMRRSRYSSHAEPHAALGLDAYTQITSPIRRYADLLLQRQIIAHLDGAPIPYKQDELFKVLATAESAQREYRQLQRKATEFWALTYLQREQMGAELEGILVKKHAGGSNVELVDYGLTGILPQGLAAQPGDRVTVRVAKVRPKRGTLRFEAP